MKITSCILSLFLAAVSLTKVSGQGSGLSLSFNGNSHVDIDSSFTSLNFPVSITFWIKAQGNNGQRAFSTNSNSNSYAGIRCQFINNGRANFHFGTGGGFTPANRRSISSLNQILFNEWVHITYVLSGATNMSVYVNGISVPSSYSGSGGSFYQPSGTSSLGRAIVTTGNWAYLTGQLDDFTIWNKALSAAEIRNMVCRRTNPNANQLLGYFDFDNPTANTVTDLAVGHVGTFGGTVGTPLSGASIGDTAYFAYPAPAIFNQTLSNGEQITISNISNGTGGIQLYEVLSAPNSLNGLPPGLTPSQYFGVFLARTDNSNKIYQLELSNYSGTTQVFQRDANDDNSWTLLAPTSVNGSTANFTSNSYTSEYIIVRQQDCKLDLGSSITTCTPVSAWLKDLYYHPSKTYTWSTGITLDSLLVNAPGTYIVQMDSLGCIKYDTIEVFGQTIQFDLGPNQSICPGDSIWVKDLYYSSTKTYLWNGQQTADSIKVGSSQLIYAEVDSAGCLNSDSLIVSVNQFTVPIFDTLLEKCIEEPKTFTFQQGNYTFLWPDGSTINSFLIDTQSTLTFYTISPCADTPSHTLLIKQNTCDSPCHIFVPNSFTPNKDAVNDHFQLGVSCTTTSFSFKIFNRWGNLVYETNDPYFEWDGSYSGKILSEGVYMYIMNYSSYGGETEAENGIIHLMR